jgi:tetratricopeptide (TPR) repeat protein
VEKGLHIGFEDYKRIYKSGIRTGEIHFLITLISRWLEKYPNDIESNIFKAEIDFANKNDPEAKRGILSILERDPENLACYELLAKESKENDKYLHSAIYVLSGKMREINEIFPWATTLRAIKNEIKRNNIKNAEKLLKSAIAEDPNNILIAIEHYRISLKLNDLGSNSQLVKIYHQRWQNCIHFKIWMAIAKMNSKNETEAVALLHSCVHSDPSGIVIRRLLGSGHEYLSIWPKDRGIFYNQQIPTSIAVSLDWNRLDSGNKEQKKSKSISGGGRGKNKQLKYNAQLRESNDIKLSPVYVILSSNLGLSRKYGPKSADVIIEKLSDLSTAFNKKPKWESYVFLPDDFNSMNRWGIPTISEIDPWKIKLSLMDLDKILKERGKEIGAVIIIGNHDVIPFHRLPNPTDDGDQEVLSDNQYSTSSSNYLLPEWPVGRLPGEKGNDPGLLIEQIRHVTKFHAALIPSKNVINKVLSYFNKRLNIIRRIKDLFKKPKDFGYSAEVWRRSSLASFRPIGKGADLRISPPFDDETIDLDNLMKAKCAYFNLHGLSNTSEWYGQRDFSSVSTNGPDFPVAISANKISKLINNIDLVFTEACYGGYIVDKSIDDSIALKLISIGSQGIIGSTCISYGSVFTPLIGGDLLGFIFWKHIKDGYSFGESLMQAKIGLVKVMEQRQGYLDGEDQKTLQSFVLYGDPLGYLEPNIYLEKYREDIYSDQDIKLVSDQDGYYTASSGIPEKIASDLNELLQSYIPGLENAEIKVKKHKINITKMINNETNQSGKIGSNLEYKTFTQILYNKSIVSEKRKHTQYARVTMDDRGKIIKLAVSR